MHLFETTKPIQLQFPLDLENVTDLLIEKPQQSSTSETSINRVSIDQHSKSENINKNTTCKNRFSITRIRINNNRLSRIMKCCHCNRKFDLVVHTLPTRIVWNPSNLKLCHRKYVFVYSSYRKSSVHTSFIQKQLEHSLSLILFAKKSGPREFFFRETINFTPSNSMII